MIYLSYTIKNIINKTTNNKMEEYKYYIDEYTITTKLSGLTIYITSFDNITHKYYENNINLGINDYDLIKNCLEKKNGFDIYFNKYANQYMIIGFNVINSFYIDSTFSVILNEKNIKDIDQITLEINKININKN